MGIIIMVTSEDQELVNTSKRAYSKIKKAE